MAGQVSEFAAAVAMIALREAVGVKRKENLNLARTKFQAAKMKRRANKSIEMRRVVSETLARGLGDYVWCRPECTCVGVKGAATAAFELTRRQCRCRDWGARSALEKIRDMFFRGRAVLVAPCACVAVGPRDGFCRTLF